MLFTSTLAINLSEFPEGYNVQSIICGNFICELGENYYNCPQDCSMSSFNAELISDDIWIKYDQELTTHLAISNNLNTTLSIKTVVQGDLINKITVPEKIALQPFEEKIIELKINNQKRNLTNYYMGEIVLTSSNQKEIMPLKINVVEASSQNFILLVSMLSDEVQHSDFLPVNIRITKQNPKFEDISLQLSLYDDKSELIQEFNYSKKVSSHIDYIELLELSEVDEGNYLLEVVANYKGNKFNSKTGTYIFAPFWTEERINILIFSIIGVIVAVLLVLGVIRYKRYKRSKIRYITPKFDLVPEESPDHFYLGKVAGSDGVKSFYNPKDLTTHMLVSGSTGTGKSVSASIFVEEALLHNIPVVIFDPTSQWTGFLKPLDDENILKFYPMFNMKEGDAHGFRGLIYNVETSDIDLNFEDYMNPGEVTIFNLNSLTTQEYDAAVTKIIQKMFSIHWDESPDLKLLVVFDEVHRLIEKYGGKTGYVALEKACREFRKWGLGLIMASQVSADFKEAVSGNILSEVQLNTKNLEDIRKVKEKYGEDYANRVTRQGIGVGLFQNPKYNDGKPWFINFKPPLHNPHKISEKELKIYMDYSEKLKDIEKELEKLKFDNKDVSDLELEFKLAKNKLKEGHFKMTELYLNSLQENLKTKKKKN